MVEFPALLDAFVMRCGSDSLPEDEPLYSEDLITGMCTVFRCVPMWYGIIIIPVGLVLCQVI